MSTRTVPPHAHDFNPTESDTFTIIVDRSWLSLSLGVGPYTLWACLLLARDSRGFVRYSQAAIVDRFRTRRWGAHLENDACSPRTIRRWYRVLTEYGLVQLLGRTTGGCRLRRVRGELPDRVDEVEIPGETYAMITKWGGPPSATRREQAGARVPAHADVRACLKGKFTPTPTPYPDDPRTEKRRLARLADKSTEPDPGIAGPLLAPWLAPTLAPCGGPALADNGDAAGPNSSNPPQPGPPVGSVGHEVKRNPFLKRKELLPPEAGGAEISNENKKLQSIAMPVTQDQIMKMAESPESKGGIAGGTQQIARMIKPGQLFMPRSMPRDPREVIGEYWGPSRPRLRQEMKSEDKVKWVVRAYSAAVHFHTGKFLGGTRGIPAQLRKVLSPASRLFSGGLSPHIYAVTTMVWLRDPSRSPDKVPPLKQIFHPSFVKKMLGVCSQMIRENPEGPWIRQQWKSPAYVWVHEFWDEARAIIDEARKMDGMTQAYLDAISEQIFTPRYQATVVAVQSAMRARRSSDEFGLNAGRWVWNAS